MPPRLPSLPPGVCICRDPNCKILFGECHCGCGGKTRIAKINRHSRGDVQGLPVRYIYTHQIRQFILPRREVVQPIDGLTKLIPLTRNQIAIVDVEDYDRLIKSPWGARWNRKSNAYYAQRANTARIGPRLIKMHDEIMPPPKGFTVDHKNGNSLDNRKDNLRFATKSQSCMNRCGFSNATGHKGVYKHRSGKYVASLRINREFVYCGIFELIEDAVAARHAKEIELFGEFSPLICRATPPSPSALP